MLASLYTIVYWLSFGFAVAGIAYVAVAAWAVRRFAGARKSYARCTSPATILKPLCGLEPGLYENLRSFCQQDYPAYQVVFGIRDPNDPAVPIVQQVINDLPDQDLALVIEPRVTGTNLKVSNLANMMHSAKHAVVIVADADMRVGPDYLAKVMAPFSDERVGAVTCLYKGKPAGGWASVLGALFINEWFLPSVLVALSFEELRYCFGATMAVRSSLLQAIGGFEGLAMELADDHLLGKRISASGHEVVLVPYLVENQVLESDTSALLTHELRWARTIKAVRPGGYAFSFVTYAVSMSGLFLIVSAGSLWAWLLVAAAIAARLGLHQLITTQLQVAPVGAVWLLPVRDVLCLLVWAGSFFGNRVQWKSHRFNLESDGQLLHEGKHSL